MLASSAHIDLKKKRRSREESLREEIQSPITLATSALSLRGDDRLPTDSAKNNPSDLIKPCRLHD